MSSKKLYLLTGGTGTLGQEIQAQADRFNVSIFAPPSSEFDILWANYHMTSYKDYIHADGVIHCAAFTDTIKAEVKRRDAVNLNVLGTQNVKEWCRCLGLPMTYISTDYVYPDSPWENHESSEVSPVNYYAMTKLIGESFLGPNDLTVRTSFKPNVWPHDNAFEDVITNADYVDVIAPMVLELITRDASGVFNVGTEPKTILELARRRKPNVKPSTRHDAEVKIPGNSTMNLDKYNKLVGNHE